MKTVEITQDYLYKIRPRGQALVMIAYVGGQTYRRVPEAAVKKILAAGVGRVVDE